MKTGKAVSAVRAVIYVTKKWPTYGRTEKLMAHSSQVQSVQACKDQGPSSVKKHLLQLRFF